MKLSMPVAALAIAVLALAPQARADDAKSFNVAAATTGAERSHFTPGIVDVADQKTAPIVIEILSVAYLPDRIGVSEGSPTGPCSSCKSSPSKPAKRR